jgi:hypothetical protein
MNSSLSFSSIKPSVAAGSNSAWSRLYGHGMTILSGGHERCSAGRGASRDEGGYKVRVGLGRTVR